MPETTQHQQKRKLLGAFYTERETANAIATLALGAPHESVLDPCFGGCAFLEAIRSRFQELGSPAPMRRVFGVDIDPGALAYLEAVKGARSRQFLVKDFLELEPTAFGLKFDVVLGNPPFIRHHLMEDASVVNAQARMSLDVKAPKTADSWLYFFHHSLRFLRPGGNLAMVLPGSFLNAAYAESARHALAKRFASANLFLVRRRLFADAMEAPVIVIARGFERPPESCRLNIVDSPDDIVTSFARGDGDDVDLTEKNGPWRLALAPRAARSVLSSVTHLTRVTQLGTVAAIHIGVVTGANKFFVLSDDAAKKNRLPASVLRSILSTSKQFSGLDLKTSDMNRLQRAGERVVLLDTNVTSHSVRLKDYLSSSEADGARRAFKCSERSPWHRLDDLKIPDAFLSYVVDRTPRLVLNRANTLSTNSIHRVWWRRRSSAIARQGWSLSLTSSLGGLSAELYGRVAGGGALKLEPSEAAAIWIPASFRRDQVIRRSFAAASKALRAGDWRAARDIADRAILIHELGLSTQDAAAIQGGHDALLALRFSLAARAKPRTV